MDNESIVTTLAVSPNGNYVFYGTEDGIFCRFDNSSNDVMAYNMKNGIIFVNVSMDSSAVVFCNSYAVYVCSVDNFDDVSTFRKLDIGCDMVVYATFSCDCQYIIGVTSFGDVNRWDATTGYCERMFKVDNESCLVTAAVLSKDEKLLAVTTHGGYIQVYDMLTHVMKFSSGTGIYMNDAIAFSDCGRYIAAAVVTATNDDDDNVTNAVTVWDTRNMYSEYTLFSPIGDNDNTVTCITFTPDSKHVICSNDNHSIVIASMDKGVNKYGKIIYSHAVYNVAVDPLDDTHIYAMGLLSTLGYEDISKLLF